MAYAVVTRDAEATEPYARALVPLGLEAVAMPVTRTEPPDDPGALVRAIELGGHSAILVASPRAALALLGARNASLPGVDVWAVGPATARVLEQAGVTPIVPEHAKDAATCARVMLARAPLAGKRVLVPRAEDGRDDAIEILRAGGAEVEAIVAYRTVPVRSDAPTLARGRELLVAGKAACCCVFAPSQVSALDALLGIRTLATRWVAIGDTTAEALRDAGAEVIAIADSPTPEGMAKGVAAVYPART
jgi:uroporphyrinogen-III synthase